METIDIKLKQVNNSEDLNIPSYAKEGDAGVDLLANIEEDVVIAPNESKLIPTGIALAIPEGYQAEVRPRSGLALKHGITVLNSPGTVDSGYRNEIGVILINHSKKIFRISRGDRIAQLVFMPYVKVGFEIVDKLDDTERGKGGFGSTGI